MSSVGSHLSRGVATTAVAEEVLVERRGRALCLTLNRPKALNALTLGMVRSLQGAYEEAAADAQVGCILMTGAGGKAFCAGGDVVGIYKAAKDGEAGRTGVLSDTFFREEYALNACIAGCPKPQVSVWEGICMGGGAGLSVHGAFRVATEKSFFAMPETGIGFFPDVGGTSFLGAFPGGVGEYVGLTGHRMGPGDLCYTGLATHFIPAASLPNLFDSLQTCAGHDQVKGVLDGFATPPPDGDAKIFHPLQHAREAIDRCFSAPDVESIEAALAVEATEWSEATLKTLRKLSPTGLKLTLKLVREGKGKSLSDVLTAEFRATQRTMQQPSDFFEGIRAALVDKDKKPRWEPATVAAVTDELLDEFCAPLGERELRLTPPAGFRAV